MLNLAKQHKVIIAICLLITLRLLNWYNPILGNKLARFQNSELNLNIQNISQSNNFNQLKLKSSPSGKYLIFNTPGGEIYISEDYGLSWKKVDQLPSWQSLDFYADDTGNFSVFYSPFHDQKDGASVIYRALKTQKETTIYSAGSQNINGVLVGNDIRGINLIKNNDFNYLTVFEGFSNSWHYLLLQSNDLENWQEEAKLDNLNHPDTNLISLGTLAVDPLKNKYLSVINNALDITQINNRNIKWAKEPSLTIYKNRKNQSNWEVFAKDLGRQGPGGGYEDLDPNQSQIFARGNNFYLFWRHSFSKLQAASLINPIDILIHVPFLNVFFLSALPNRIDRDEIYFTNLTNGNNLFNPPVRLNDSLLTYENTQILFQSGQEIMQGLKNRADKYFVRLGSAVSSNGQYLTAAWTDFRQIGKRPLYLTFSKDFGKTWSKNQAVFPDLTDKVDYFDISISDTGRLNLVFANPKDNRIYAANGQIN